MGSTDIKYPYCNPEIWGGIECTINRLNDQYRDQLALTDHYNRPGDIERFAALGIRKLRYPVLWEYHEKSEGEAIDWSWATRQLNTIRNHKIDPIVGLLHHGSGPVFTHLLDKDFPYKLAGYAKQVATQFPWVSYYTPVNEPLTTARFSGLYGFWYPHHGDEKSFVQILLNQLKGVVLAMQAIRTVNPRAKLVQTEDLSKTHCSEALHYQAEFENTRRWLTYDLLCGKVDQQHFFWNYFISLGIEETELLFFLENICPPAVMGFNYYVTSERYLDEEIEKYPDKETGGNGQHQYIDTEAVRTGHCSGLTPLVKEAWQRYQLPIAITECHLTCTREEQLRWLKETWDSCCSLKKDGIDIKAVTAWSLVGAYDWNSLLTAENNLYEAGVFDISNHRVRATSLAKMIQSLAANGNFEHPLLDERGWWHRNSPLHADRMNGAVKKSQPLFIIGKTGTLGIAFSKICQQRSIHFIAIGREDMQITDEKSIRAYMEQYKPWGIINASGYVNVDEAEANREECYAVNTNAPALLAKLCRQYGILFMTFSSDLVFDGNKRSPYFEADGVLPLNVYGASKAEGERLVLKENDAALIIRTSAFFGPWDKYNFVYTVVNSLQQDKELCMPADVIVSPTYVPDLCQTALDLFIDEEAGIWHLSNDGMASWSALAGMIAERKGFKENKLLAKPLSEMGWKANRPLYSVLQSDKGIKLPHFDNALNRYFEQCIV